MPTPLADTPKPPTPMETMANERKNPPFDLRRMTYAMGDGEKGASRDSFFAASPFYSEAPCLEDGMLTVVCARRGQAA